MSCQGYRGLQGSEGRQPSTIQPPAITGELGSDLPHSQNKQMPRHPKLQRKHLVARWQCLDQRHEGREYCQPVSTILFSEDPCGFLSGAKKEKKRGNIRENKLLSYCIALVHLPNKMKGLMWHHLQKTQWQTHPTRGCRCPAKRQMIYLAGESRKYLREELRKGKRQRNPITSGSGLGICVWVFWREHGQACGHSSN